MRVRVIGGGLAGAEASLTLAALGFEVDLYEMRPKVETGAHRGGALGQLVCSNSLGSSANTIGSGLLKEEACILGSFLIPIAKKFALPSGGALSVDRVGFEEFITNLIKENPKINLINEEYTKIENTPTIIATGPLTSEAFCAEIQNQTGQGHFSFFDAIAPIVERDSINFDVAFFASRYNKGGADYINCPMDKPQYEAFYDILVHAETVLDTKASKFFESCLPVEVLAARGVDTLRFGPLKPVGLKDERKEQIPYAVVQLRQDDKMGNLYNLVGFQTNLKWGEQKRLISAIPGLENAKIVRYGVMHANTFINSPKILNKTLQNKFNPNIFFAGQLSGVEGYTESIATGLFAAINMAKFLNGQKMLELPQTTMLGALLDYITFDGHKNFQPINSNWGIIAPMPMDKAQKRDKKIKNALLANRALETLAKII